MDELDKQIYLHNLNRCDCFGAAAKKCFTCDDVFGNSFRRFPDGNAFVTKATDNCKFNFKKSAWYAELKRIYNEEPELLLVGEKEMNEGTVAVRFRDGRPQQIMKVEEFIAYLKDKVDSHFVGI